MRELIAFTDGGSRPTAAACGFYLPESGVSAGKFLGLQTNNFAEYSGLIMALEYAIENGYTKLTVFSDSKLIVNQMKGVYRVESGTLLPLFSTAYSLAMQLDFEINWIPREKNTEADAVCNQVLDQVQGMKN